jgi:uncharacterized coiled-coil protein SlyX
MTTNFSGMIKQDGVSHINKVVTQQKRSGMMQSKLLLLLLLKIKESRNRPGAAQRVPEGLGSQIS